MGRSSFSIEIEFGGLHVTKTPAPGMQTDVFSPFSWTLFWVPRAGPQLCLYCRRHSLGQEHHCYSTLLIVFKKISTEHTRVCITALSSSTVWTILLLCAVCTPEWDADLIPSLLLLLYCIKLAQCVCKKFRRERERDRESGRESKID